jgi:hypothetical protein
VTHHFEKLRQLWIALAFVPMCVHAQGAWNLQPGMRLRLHVTDSTRQVSTELNPIVVIGTVTRATSDSVFLLNRHSDTTRVALATVQRVYRSGGKARLASMAGYALLGGLVFYAIGNDHEPGQGAWEAGRLGLAGGAALGWFRPHESWDRLGR